MALIEFNDDVGGRHPWEVLNTQNALLQGRSL
jgi:hypothetical protein